LINLLVNRLNITKKTWELILQKKLKKWGTKRAISARVPFFAGAGQGRRGSGLTGGTRYV